MSDLGAERWQRLKALFGEALDAPLAEREVIISALAAQDSELAAELRSLLSTAGDIVDEGFSALQGLAAACGGAVNAEADAELERRFVGRRAGAYLLVRLIGRGGMGAVFLAERADGAYTQTVAVKLVASPLASGELVRRSHTERQVLAALAHPGIARLLDAGELEPGVPFLVLEYVDGVPLEQYCRERSLRREERLRLFVAVCDAVDHAHRALVVHRDLKPANILVTASGEPKLLDFGIAKILASDGGAVAGVTREASCLTPAFASPEQLRNAAIGTPSDVFQLGVLLYRLLTDRHPFRETDSFPLVARSILEDDPPRPSQVAASGAAGDLDWIALKALDKDPERRYRSAAALADDVRRQLAGQPVSAAPDSLRYRAGKLIRRHRLGVAAAALLLASLLAGLGSTSWQAGRAARERDRARAESAKVAEMNTFLRSVLTSADPVRGSGRAVTVAEVLDRSSARLSQGLERQPDVEADLRATLGETYRNLGLSPEAEREHRRALTLLRSSPGQHPSRLASERVRLAQALSDQGRWAEAEKELRVALGAFESSEGRGVAYGRALDLLMVVLQSIGRSEEAIAVGRDALEILRDSSPGDPVALASVLNNLAIALGNRGELREAESLHREAVAATRRARGDRHPQTAEALANLAGVLDMRGDYAEAMPVYLEALALQEDLLGERHFEYVRTLTSYANLLWLMKQSTEAEPVSRRALALAESALGAEHHLTAYAENILGGVLLDLSQGVEAERHIRAALASRRRSLPAGHWLTASAQSNLGAALLLQGRHAAAEAELLAAHAALLADRGPAHEKTVLTAARLADLYEKTGDPRRAARYRGQPTGPPAS